MLASRHEHRKPIATLWFVCTALPFIVGVSVFLPVLAHYHTTTTVLTNEQVAAWIEYAQRNRRVIDEFNSFRVMAVHGKYVGEDAIRLSEQVLEGELEVPGWQLVEINQSFSGDDVLQGTPSNRLDLSGLLVSDILLEAYRYSRSSKYLDAAANYAISLAEYEQSMWLPHSYIWNDHAVALRVQVISRILAAIAFQREDVDVRAVGSLLTALDRSVRQLSKRDAFACSTNHGLMQSMGVMHAAIIAPALPSVGENLNSIIERTDRQLRYFVSRSGVITEHSTMYQEFGLGLLTVIAKYLTILDPPISEDWRQRYQNALEYYDQLLRPDGTLPRHGDTHGISYGLVEAIIDEDGESARVLNHAYSATEQAVWMSEDFGYWSEWRSGAHLLVAWASFAAGAHKHADELSIIFWMDGEEWWTAGGYWDYGRPIRKEGIGWNGSNAPHARDEPTYSARVARATAWYSDASISFLQLNRTLGSGYSVDRTVIRLFDDNWIIVDVPADKTQPLTDSVWQTMPAVRIEQHPDKDSLFTMGSANSDSKLDVQVLLGADSTSLWLYGSDSPFGGWISDQGIERKAKALLLTAPARSWSGLAWRRQLDSQLPAVPVVDEISWDSSDSWTVIAQTNGDKVTLRREGGRLYLSTKLEETSALIETAGERQELAAAEDAFGQLQSEFPRFRGNLPLRLKIFKLALLAGCIQLIALLFLRRWLRGNPYSLPGLAVLAVSHLLFGVWLHLVYFAP